MADEPKVGENTFTIDDSEYQEALKDIKFDEFSTVEEANNMTPATEIIPDEKGKALYPVPIHLMGILIGRQRQTMRRIMMQTSTEMEQCSWVDNGKRIMGFSITGAAEAVKAAIDVMINTISDMEDQKATKFLKGHLRIPKKKAGRGKANPKPTPRPNAGTKQPTGKKEICPHFLVGSCKFGVKCRSLHSRGK